MDKLSIYIDKKISSPDSIIQDYNQSNNIVLMDDDKYSLESTSVHSSNRSGIESIFDIMIFTPFYRTLREDYENGCDPDPSTNYVPYNLFALKTRLLPWLHRTIDKRITMHYVSVKKDMKMYQTIYLNIGGKRIDLSLTQIRKIQTYVDWLTRDYSALNNFKGSDTLHSAYSLLVDYETFIDPGLRETELVESMSTYNNLFNSTWYNTNNSGLKIPKSWIYTILPYININPLLYPRISSEGLLVDLSDIDYLSSDGNFQTVYQKLQQNVYTTIIKMFYQGYVSNPPIHIIENWNLIPIDEQETLYKPDWYDPRLIKSYQSMNGLIMSQIYGENYFDFLIGKHLLIRHEVAYLAYNNQYNLVFKDQYARFWAETPLRYEEMISIQDNIDNFQLNSSGQILVIPANRMSVINLYIYTLHNLLDVDDPNLKIENWIIYQLNDLYSPYILSIKLPNHTDTDYVNNVFMRNVSNLSNILEQQLSQTRYKNTSLYDAIENNTLLIENNRVSLDNDILNINQILLQKSKSSNQVLEYETL